MRLDIDARDLDRFRLTLRDAAKQYPKSVVSAALKDAAKPMLTAARQEVPVRKGATRRDLRLKSVRLRGGDVAVLIGVSKKKGKSGWRTHFITRGSAHNRKDDFLGRAYDRTIGVVVESLGNSLGKKIEAYFKRRTK